MPIEIEAQTSNSKNVPWINSREPVQTFEYEKYLRTHLQQHASRMTKGAMRILRINAKAKIMMLPVPSMKLIVP